MSKLFPTVELGQVAAISMGQSPDSSTVSELNTAGLPFLQGNAEFGEKHPSPKYSCMGPPRIGEAGATLISVRAPVGQTNIADRDYCIGRGLAAVKTSIYGRVLCRAIMAHQAAALKKVSQGTTFEAIGRNDLFSLLIPRIPPQEAECIESILDTLDTQIQKTEALIAKLDKIKEGLLHDLLTRGIDQNGQLRPTPEQAPELYKASALVLIPMEWDIRTTGEISRSIVPGRDKPQLSNTGIPWITISDLIENRVAKSMLGLYVDERQIRTSMIRTIPAGSVIMSCVGEFGVTSITECKTIINQQLHCFIVNTGINADWLMYSLRQKKNTIDRSATQTTIKYLNKAGCESIVLPTPSLDEQISIVSQISSLDRKIGKEKKYSDKLAKTKVGLMDDLLTGHVRVTPLLKDAV
jgi:type I restriction enzyme S subunit